MGNLTNKQITKTDTCLHFFVNHLKHKYGYELLKLPATKEHLTQFYETPLQPKDIIQFGDLYLFQLSAEDAKDLMRKQAEDCMISAFLDQLCHTGLNENYASEAFQTREQTLHIDTKGVGLFSTLLKPSPSTIPPSKVYIMAYSQANWCRVVSTCMVEFRWNPFEEMIEPHIKFLCSYKPNIHIADKMIDPNQPESQIIRQSINKSKLGISLVLLMRAFDDLKYETYSYVSLECKGLDLLQFYYNVGFELGNSPKHKHIWRFGPSGWDELPRVVSRSLTQSMNFISDFYIHHGRPPPSFNDSDTILTSIAKWIHIASYPHEQDMNESEFYMYYDLQKYNHERFVKTKINKYKPNVVNVLNSVHVFSSDEVNNQHSIVLNDVSQCYNSLFEQEFVRKPNGRENFV